jgi:PST family polysaccharide transporter
MLARCVINVIQARWLPRLPHRRTSIRRFLRFSGGLLGTQTISYVTKNIDDFAIGVVSGPAVLGIYNRAYQLLMAPLNRLNAPLTRVALPVLSRVQDEPQTLDRYVARLQLVGCYGTAVTFAVAAGVAHPLVQLLFGHKWSAVAPIFAVLAIGGVFRAISQLAYWMYLAKGLSGKQLKQYLVTRPLMILLILAGLPWGGIGVAVGHTVAYFMYWVASLWHAGRSTKIAVRPLFGTAIRAVLCLALPCGLAANFGTFIIQRGPPVEQLAMGLAFTAVYLLVIACLNRTVRADMFLALSLGRRALLRRSRNDAA